MFLNQKYIRHTVSSGSMNDDYVGVKQIGTIVLLGCSTNLIPNPCASKTSRNSHIVYAVLDFLQEIQVHITIFFTLIPTKGDTTGKK